ncbi:hypothetical protein Agub_g2555 [Astrephomene gubernaculifera]|uniref:Uncharacterized protein n=1 Tax=Astrephomene gubernaculifera TaxID=47775 RepID=A0AAD3DKY8_9CHLO|nr:hypothetical protein Agub_g2555 [Astrephomene gubernaculifera]
MKARSTGSGGFRATYYTDDDFMYDDDMDYVPPARKKPMAFGGGGKERPGAPKRPAPAQSPPPGAGGQSTSPGKAVRSRPTNNQLLYKAYFRWAHYPHKLKNANLPVETDACASVTAAFLQVLQIMQTAEQLRHGSNKRNVLQILSSNTRRTKVVELSSGTHRVPDELKKHYLSDGEGGQYSTNLDRNRYGNDDNYLFTVIRYDLEFLGLCPCMVDVEIIDAKQGNSSIIVSAGTEVCTCQGGPPPEADGPVAPVPLPAVAVPLPAAPPMQPAHHPHHQHAHAHPHPHHHAGGTMAAVGGPLGLPAHQHHQHQHQVAAPTLSGGGGMGGRGAAAAAAVVKAEYGNAGSSHGLGPVGGAAAGYGSGGPPDIGPVPSIYGGGGYRGSMGGGGLGGPMGRESPKRSGTSVSQLFDALVMAATGGAEGAAVADGLGDEPPVTSPAHADRPDRGAGGPSFGGGGGGGATGPRKHAPPGRNKSKLWSLNNLSFGGEVDSLQNALDAFREQDEIASGDPAVFLNTGGASAGGIGPDGSAQRSDSLRQRRRKPLRNSSVLGRPASSGGVAPLGARLGLNLREKSDDNLKLATDAELGAALGGGMGLSGSGLGPMGGGFHHHHHHHGGLPLGVLPPGATQVSSLASGEDDNDGEAEADDAAARAKAAEELCAEGEGEAGGEELEEDEGLEEGCGMGGGRRGGGVGPTASGTLARGGGGGRSPLRHHVRHVPRQSSVANLGPRVANSTGGGGGHAGGAGGLGLPALLGPGGLGGSASAAIAGEQLRRIANELEVMRQENRSLRQQLQRANTGGSNGGSGGGGLPAAQQPDNSESARLRKLEAELSSLRSEMHGLSGAKKSADEENKQLKRDLLASQQQVAALLNRLLGTSTGGAAGGVGVAQQAPQQQQQLGSVAGAFDPSSFAAHFAAMRQAAPPQQQQGGLDDTECRPASAPPGLGDAATTVANGGIAAFGIGSDEDAGALDPSSGQHHLHAQQGRKRSAEDAGLAAGMGTGPMADAAVAAAVAGEPHHHHQQQLLSHQQHQPEQEQHGGGLVSMPSFSPAILPTQAQQQQQHPLHPQPADSGTIATPADSTCFSDVAQLLALPNLDAGFHGAELGGPYAGMGGSGGGAGGSTAVAAAATMGQHHLHGGLAASSGLPIPGSGSGSGSGTASVPQMPQLDQHHHLLMPAYMGQQQR